MTTIVIPCGKAKQDRSAMAQHLYTGGSFRLARDAAKRDGRPWIILSSLYGLVQPTQVLQPYEAVTRTKADQYRLAAIVRTQLDPGDVESWCPHAYNEALRMAGVRVVAEPLAGLRLGFRHRWWTEHAR